MQISYSELDLEKIVLTSLSIEDFKNIIRVVLVEFTEELDKQETKSKKDIHEEILLNPTEIVKLLRISKVTLQKWMKAGKVPYYRLGRKVYFKESELLDTINLRKNRV